MSTVMTSPEDRHIAESVVSGSAAEIIGGAAAIVLTILGLAHVASNLMLTIATIAIGVGQAGSQKLTLPCRPNCSSPSLGTQ